MAIERLQIPDGVPIHLFDIIRWQPKDPSELGVVALKNDIEVRTV